MADWTDVGSSHDGWEDVGDGDSFSDHMKQHLKDAVGGVEAVGGMLSGIPAYIGGGLAGAATLLGTGGDVEKARNIQEDVSDYRYHPKTDSGKLAEQGIGEAFDKAGKWFGEGIEQQTKEGVGDISDERLAQNRLAADIFFGGATNFAPIPGGKLVGAAGKAVERSIGIGEKAAADIPKSKAAEAFDKEEAVAANDGWQDVGSWGIRNGEPVPPQELTAKQIKEIKKAQPKAEAPNPMQSMANDLTGDVVSRGNESPTMDRTARELQTFNAIQNLLRDDNQTLLDRAREPKKQPEAVPGQEPIYVDPQGQAFRGNPADPLAARALEQQSDAFTKEHMWMRPEERTPEGEPLQPLTDVTREPHEPIPEDQMAPNASREYDLKDQPISSNGPIGRQRGAIATKDIIDALGRALNGAMTRAHEAFSASKYHNILAHDSMDTARDLMEKYPDKAGKIINHMVGELDKMGYGDEVLAPLKDAYSIADKLEAAKSSAETPWATAGKFNQTRKALLNIDKQINDLTQRMENLIPTRDVPSRQAVINLDQAERGIKQRWRNIANRVADLEHERDSLNIQSPLREENLRTNEFTRPGENAYSVEDVDMDAVRRNLPNEKPSGTGASTVVPFVPLKQRGAVGDLSKQPRDIARNEQQRNMAQNFKHLGLSEWDVIKDKQEALTLAKDAPDIGKDIGQKSLVSGINMETGLSNNPILKFARTTFRDAHVLTEGLSRKYITSNDTGLSHLWPKFSTEQRINLMDALMEADKRQRDISDGIMNSLGFTDEMKQFVQTFQEADSMLLRMQNRNADLLGMTPTDRRIGHFPGIFVGSYKSLVVLTDKNGKKTVGAVLATDTKAQHKLAIDYAKEKFPDAKFIDQDRGGLAGVTNRYYSDIFSGWNDVLNMLGREDPRFQEVTSIVDKAVLDANNRLFNFNVHELAKRGVTGNEGNKPWLSRKENANGAFKALIRYFEQGFEHHALQVPLNDMREVLTAPETDHMPNARKYLQAYTKKVTGDDLNDFGRALNTIIDQPFKFMPNFSWDKNRNVKFGIGVGPGEALKVAGVVKNNMAQLYMGWFNYMFTLSQWAQPMQTATPFLQTVASRVGMSPASVVTALTKGGVDFMTAFAEHASGKEMKGLDPNSREMFKYALDRGMLTFSEMERAVSGTQSAFSRNKNALAEANMKIGEQATRTPVFMAFGHMLLDAGVPKDRAFAQAENLTNASMIDYHQWERPMIYSKMGVVGGFMSGLTTFKHGYASQQAYLAKQAISPVGGASRVQGIAPLAWSAGAAVALMGITGMPFYNEADTAFRLITNHLMGEEKSIREAVLGKNPEWLNSGAISAATNLNLQSKFSSADMIPDYDHPLRALSPYGEGAWNIASTGYDLATHRDAQSVRNFAGAVTPSGWKGVPENYLGKDENGNLLNKNGLPAIHRSPEEWQTRMFTGVRSQREALDRETTWDARQKEKADTDARKEIATEYERRIVNNNMTDDAQSKLQDEYMNRKGDVRELLGLWQKAAIEKQKTEKERLQGTPNSLPGINRYDYYNK